MATETGEGLSSHVRGVTVTTVCTLAGIVAGVASAQLTAGVVSAGLPSGYGDVFGLYVLGVAILAELPVMKALGVQLGDFSTKDKIYVGFMTAVLWYVSWTILLTAGTLN